MAKLMQRLRIYVVDLPLGGFADSKIVLLAKLLDSLGAGWARVQLIVFSVASIRLL